MMMFCLQLELPTRDKPQGCCAVACCGVLPLLQESDIVRKLQTNRASTTDMHNNAVSVGDYVTIMDAAAAAKAGPGAKKERGGECAE
jgi:hypothetical protein